MSNDPRQQQFWQDAEQQLWDDLNEVLIEAYMSGVEGGVNILPGNIQPLVNFDVVNAKVLEFARAYRYDNLHGITETTRQQTQQAIADWIQSGSPLSALENALEPIYGEARASSIATTEVTRVFSNGNLDAWESTGMVEGGTWMTAQDELVCPICSELNGSTVGIGDMDAAPPSGSHPNCRCWLQPVLSEELVQKKLEEIFS